MDLPPELRKARFNPQEAPKYIKAAFGVDIATATLNKMRCVGGGPAFEHFGRAVFYARAGLDEWVAARLGTPKTSTSDNTTSGAP